MNNNPLVSIIIVNWNGKKWLQRCLDSLFEQTYRNYEIVFVDNASSDDSVEYVRTNYPLARIVETGSNLGFAGGNNRGVGVAEGEFIILLNNDTWVEKNYIEKFLNALLDNPKIGCAQSKLVLMYEPTKLDVCGSFWTSSTFLYHFGYAQDENDPRFNKAMPVFSNKGAAMIIRRSLIDKIGLFDEDFWCYYEETDFCHRAWISGFECWYFPEAVCYHAMGGSSKLFDNSFIQFHNFKNKLASFIKNFEIITILWTVPTYVMISVALSVAWFFQGKRSHSLALLKAIFWNIKNIKKLIKKRKCIQQKRTTSDREIFLKVKREPRLMYYFYLFAGLNKFKE